MSQVDGFNVQKSHHHLPPRRSGRPEIVHRIWDPSIRSSWEPDARPTILAFVAWRPKSARIPSPAVQAPGHGTKGTARSTINVPISSSCFSVALCAHLSRRERQRKRGRRQTATISRPTSPATPVHRLICRRGPLGPLPAIVPHHATSRHPPREHSCILPIASQNTPTLLYRCLSVPFPGSSANCRTNRSYAKK